MTELIDAVLRRHPDYLAAWATNVAKWPRNLLAQHPDRWMAELAPLVKVDLVFGRLAVLGWCLLDADVARVGSASGLLPAMTDGIREPASEVLTPEGVRLLCRRAPSAALSAGLLAPVVNLLGLPGGGAIERITLARTPRKHRGTGLWAASYEDKVWMGSGEYSKRVMQDASPVPRAMSFSQKGVLHVMDTGGAVIRRYRDSDDQYTDDEWSPGSWIVASSEDAIAGFDHGDGPDRLPLLAWGRIDGGGPMALPPLDNGITMIAVAGEQVVAVADDRVWFGGPDREWRPVAPPGPKLGTVAADETGVAFGTSDGFVFARVWDQPGVSAGSANSARSEAEDGSEVSGRSDSDAAGRWVSVPALPGQKIELSASGGGRTVVASYSEVALVRAGAVEARLRPEEGKRVTAVALSPDGDTLAVAGTLMLRFWRLDAASEMRLTSFTADTPEGEDLLGIQPTVDALAALISARAVEPPLSVGLFGAWGSGKSFFMRKVEKRVREISDESRSSERGQASIWAWRNIRHVRFNAWQYAAADVWAGLLEALVRELSRPTAGQTLDLPFPAELTALETARVRRLAGAETVSEGAGKQLVDAERTRNEAAKDVAAARFEVITAKADVIGAGNRAVTEVVQDQAIASLDDALQHAGLPPVGADLRDTWRELATARRSAESVSGFLRGRRRTMLLSVSAAPVLGLVVALLLAWADAAVPWLTGAVTALLTFVLAAAAWLRSSAQDLQAGVERIEAAEAQARTVEVLAHAKEADAKQTLHAAELKVQRAQLVVEVAEREVAVAEARVAIVTPGVLVEEYLEGRHESDDYRAMLGLLGTVRRDLDVVSQGVAAHNRELSENPDADLDNVVNRVVLYVDDLDRCHPDVVVKVLEAVSMLMSFPLFVVVVAVDSHWISRSLKHVYEDMLSDGQVTPDHYLEKIFQLPVWLDQPDAEAARSMARALLGVEEAEAATDAPAMAADPGAIDGTGRVAAAGNGDPTVPPSSRPARTRSPEGRNIALATTPPESVTLGPSETAAIAELAPLLTRSPRALKRYLNTYRLLKALLDPSELGLARVLLAVATGRPATGERLFALLPDAEARTIADVIKDLPERDRAWLGLATDRSWLQIPCTEAWPISQQVRRFLFRSESGVGEPPDQ